MTEIKLTKRYPQSRAEDITDAFMRGYEQGRNDGLKVGKQIVLGVFETYINADRKTEPSEHRDCINCEDASDCAKCRGIEDEPQTDCETCKHTIWNGYEDAWDCQLCDVEGEPCHYEPKQTERSE